MQTQTDQSQSTVESNMTIEISSLEQLSKVLSKVEQLRNVIAVNRVVEGQATG